MIYFFKLSTRNLIKIGRSVIVQHRHTALKSDYRQDMVLLGTMPCKSDRLAEQYLHKRFEAYRVRRTGEFFYESQDILDFINYVCEKYPLEYYKNKSNDFYKDKSFISIPLRHCTLNSGPIETTLLL